MKKFGTILVVIISIAAVIGLVWFLVSGPPEYSTSPGLTSSRIPEPAPPLPAPVVSWQDADNSLAARIYLEGVIKDKFAPRKMKFPTVFDDDPRQNRTIKGNEQIYVISSWYDVENDYGVMTRTRYLASVQQTGDHQFVFLSIEPR
ncbi:hypothetical protein FACS189479_05600 [Spirochaetia bacterium]|nr:hypothetical protein FACS189479_05600 [Spirochaetia bacterium]